MINNLTLIGRPLLATFGGKAFLSPSRSYHNTTASGGGRLLPTPNGEEPFNINN